MASLVGALVEMARAEGDSSVSVREEVRLDALLREIVEDCRVEADGRGCEFALAADCDRQFWGDPELLRRAFENVIRNAVKYSPAGQRVEIHLDADSAAARVRVRDCGPGVPQGHLTKVFQPFYRVDSARGASTGGVGLGLAIAQRSIALHHGTITARNMNPGLEVSITLPFSAAAPKG
jgi:two-component system sensor histidine kinase CpxA